MKYIKNKIITIFKIINNYLLIFNLKKLGNKLTLYCFKIGFILKKYIHLKFFKNIIYLFIY